MAIDYTITQDGQEISYTIQEGVGPAGPNNITTSTGTDITGILKGDGSNVGAAVALTDYDIPAVVKSASFTADNGGRYSVVATGTVTDPSPVEGKGFEVFVRNGTATVGGTAYAVAGTVIRRVYHSGAWANYVYKVDSTYVDVSSNQTVAGVKTFTGVTVLQNGASVGQDGSPPAPLYFADGTTYEASLGAFNGLTADRQIALPNADGNLPVVAQTDGTIRNTDLDYANTADIGAALADADEVFVSDGGGNTTRVKSALSRFWTYIKAKIESVTLGSITSNGTLTVGSGTWNGATITGAQAFSSTTRPTSAGTGSPASDSLITKADAIALFPKVSAYKSSDQTGLTTGAWNKITFDAEVYDTAATFASSTFTAPSAGYCMVQTAIYKSGTSGVDAMAVFKNGSEHKRLSRKTVASGEQVEGSAVVQVAANDTLEIHYFAQNATDITGAATITWVMFTMIP